MISEKTPFVLYGGDYNPDQWPKETIIEDNIVINVVAIWKWLLNFDAN